MDLYVTCILLDRRRCIHLGHQYTELHSDICYLHSRYNPAHSAHQRILEDTHIWSTHLYLSVWLVDIMIPPKPTWTKKQVSTFKPRTRTIVLTSSEMSNLTSIRMYTDKDAHKYTQIPAAGQRTHLYPWGVRMHFESCWHGFSSGAQKSSFSSHSSPVDKSTHTSPKHVQIHYCVCWCVCRFPIFTFKEIFNVIWKRSMQAHTEPEEL